MTRKNFLWVALLICVCFRAGAAELRVSQPALEHTLVTSLFSGADGRAYLRGGPGKPGCPVSLDSPKLSFDRQRILLHLHAVASIGPTVHGRCLGINLDKDVDVSMLPAAEGQSIAFTDVRLDRLSGSRELDFLLMPFLSRQVPSSLKVDAAWLLRRALENSRDRTGYAIRLDRLVVHSVAVESTHLLVDMDGDLSID